jgi:hypothetical protein
VRAEARLKPRAAQHRAAGQSQGKSRGGKRELPDHRGNHAGQLARRFVDDLLGDGVAFVGSLGDHVGQCGDRGRVGAEAGNRGNQFRRLSQRQPAQQLLEKSRGRPPAVGGLGGGPQSCHGDGVAAALVAETESPSSRPWPCGRRGHQPQVGTGR